MKDPKLHVLLFLLFSGYLRADIIYVNQNAGGSNNGSSWTDAFTNLQFAIDAAVPGDEIWVAKGVYLPTKDTNGNPNPTDARHKVFFINKDIKLYGGFLGNEDFLAERDLEQNLTVLSGDIDQNDQNADGNFIAEDYSQVIGSNTFRIVWLRDVSNACVVDGFVITAGKLPTGGSYAGMLIRAKLANTTPVIRNCRFHGHKAYWGAAMAILGNNPYKADPTIENCLFSGNWGTDRASGIYNFGWDSGPTFMTVRNCVFEDNKGNLGTAIFNHGGSANGSVIINCVFRNNTGARGGAVFNYSGGNHQMINCTFVNNHASVGGGAIRMQSSSPTLLKNCVFWGNTSPSGPNLSGDLGAFTLSHCLLSDASCPGNANCGDGMIYNQSPQFVNAPADLHLLSTSPAVNAGTSDGTPTDDLDGNDRPFSCTQEDMGAYEYQGGGSLLTCYRDSDGDGLGDAASPQDFCNTCGAGYISDDTDCNDNDAQNNPGQPYICNDLVHTSTDELCKVLFTAGMGLEGSADDCYNLLAVTIKDSQGKAWTGTGSATIPSGYAGQTLTFVIGDESTDKHCWGRVKVEDKSPPVFNCTPEEITQLGDRDLLCTDLDDILADVDLLPKPTVSDNCSNVTPWHEDEVRQADNCDAITVIRRWYAVDEAGNEAEPCVQTIRFTKPTLAQIDKPQTDVKIACDDIEDLLAQTNEDGSYKYTRDQLEDANGHPTPFALEELHGKGSGFPYVGDQPLDEALCNLGAEYEDISVIEVCDNTVQIIRQWTLLDWCAIGDQDDLNNGISVNHRQVIKVGDFEGPVATAPDDVVVRADAFNCVGSYTVADVSATDNCADDLTTTATLYEMVWKEDVGQYGQPLGTQSHVPTEIGPIAIGSELEVVMGATYKIVYTVSDACGNASTAVHHLITAEDNVAPVAICDDDMHVSLGGDGLAQVSADDVDEGSWDNCSPVDLYVSRKLASVALRDAYLARVYDLTFEELVLSDWEDKDKSADADIYIKDLDDDGQWDDDEEEAILRYKDEMWYSWWDDQVYFLCEDTAERVVIELLAKEDNHTDGLTNVCWNDVLVEDKIAPECSPPDPITIDCTELPWGFEPTNLEDLAGFGSATPSDNCATTITELEATADWNCNSGTITRSWIATDEGGLTSLDACTQTITVTPVHNYEIKFPKDPAAVECQENNPDTIEVTHIGCDLLTVNVLDERFEASGDACYKIKRTYSLINWCEYNGTDAVVPIGRDEDGDNLPGDEEVYLLRRPDYSYTDADNDESNGFHRDGIQSTGYWSYVQYIKVVDNTAPVIDFTGDPEFCSEDGVDCEGEVSFDFVVTDVCAEPDLEVKALINGEPVTVTGDFPNYHVSSVENIGTHQLEIHAIDGCRNSALLLIDFEVKDCKAPTPICINGLAIELMPVEANTDVDEDGDIDNGAMEVWASDFEVSGPGEDCTDIKGIYITRDANGDDAELKDGLMLTCDDPDTMAVRIWAVDGAGNQDYCLTYVLVQDNMFSLCTGPGQVSAAGLITNVRNETVENVQVNLSGMLSGDVMTTVDGNYQFNNLTPGGDYTIAPQKDDDDLNGVSTFDLVLITKHILGTKQLQDPYQLIAADANNSRSISALDLIQLRKLILSVSRDLSSNTSWRFIPRSYRFPDASNPWAESFPELINYNDLQDVIINGDYIAVKIGDVNGNAIPNSLVGDQRNTVGTFQLQVQDQTLVAGHEYRIAFRAADLTIQGCQFTLKHEGLELMDIEYRVAKAENFAVIAEDVLTMSWNGKAASEDLFTLVVKANQNTQLNELLGINSRYTTAEAYNQADELLDVALTFDGQLAESTYELYQNVPNPFQGQTMISFSLPEAMSATIKIQDVQGRTLQLIRGQYESGLNQLRVNSTELPATGVLYYTLETDQFTATRKMVVIGE